MSDTREGAAMTDLSPTDGSENIDECAHRYLKTRGAGQAVCVYCGRHLHRVAPTDPEWKEDQYDRS